MKILGIVLAVLMLGLSILVGTLATNKSFKASKEIAAAMADLPDEMKAAVASEVPSAGRLKFGGIVGALAAVAAFGLLVVTFVKKPLVLALGGATILLALIAAVAYPTLKTGPLDGLAPRPQELIALGMAVVGAAGALLASRQRQRQH